MPYREERFVTVMTNIREYLKNRQIVKNDEYDKKIAHHRRKVRFAICVAVAAVVAAAAGVKIYLDNKSFDGYNVDSTMKYQGTGSSRYYRFGECLLAYSDDGISYINDGTVVWNQAFEMKKPLVDICGDTMAICDMEDTTVYIYDTEGQKGKVNTVYPVIDLEVSNQGVIAAITEDAETNRIEMFDRDGNSIAAGQTYVTGDGCPIDISLSDDGTKLAASYIYVDGGTAKSKVVFYNYSEVGKNEVGRIVGGFNHYDTTIVSRVEFISNDEAVAYGDNLFTIYSVKQKPEKVNEVKFDKNIKSIFYNSEYIGAVMETGDYDKPYMIKLYDTDGDEEMSNSTDFMYTGLELTDDNLILYNDRDIMVMTLSGRERYRGTIKEGIYHVVGTDSGSKYYIINGAYNIMKITLK